VNRDEVLDRLREARLGFDERVGAIPESELSKPTPGSDHSPKDIVAHVSAYDELMVDRLRAARRGETTAFDRDREGWEAFNERVWAEATLQDAPEALARARRVFGDLLGEVGRLTDGELNATEGITVYLDPGWLDGRRLWELIGIDGFEHYPMHYTQLETAVRSAGSED
jgi:hypothetical protein